MLENWTKSVIRHRRTVLISWFAVVGLGLLASSQLNSHLTTSLTIPGSSSDRASMILAKNFQENSEGTFTVLLNFRNATKAEVQLFENQISTAAQSIPGAKIDQERALGGVLYASVSTPYKLTEAASYTAAFRAALDREGLPAALVTGPPAIYSDVTPVLANDLHRGQLIAIFLALLLLLITLGFCWAILVPFIFALATIAGALGIVFLLAQKFLMVLYIPNIVELIGLGLAIDYSLLIVHRFRRELAKEEETEPSDAIVRTMETAGRTVLLSGFTVALGLATLLFIPVPFVRSLGAAGLLVPAISVLAALTLQPALLSYLGRSGAVPRRYSGLIAQKDLSRGMWGRVAALVIRRPLTIFLLSIAIVGILASSIFWLRVTPSSLTAIPADLESARALKIVTDKAGPGIITPIQIVIDLGSSGQVSAANGARLKLTGQITKNSEVLVAATGEKTPYVDATGRYLRLFVISRGDLGSAQTQRLVSEIRNVYIPQAGFPVQAKAYISGEPAQGADLLHRLRNSFPWIVFLMLVFTYLVLIRAFKSLILPLKAIVLDLLSVGVAFSSLVLVFRDKVGASILGTYHLDQIEAWVLIFLFAVLFGLSMDYEVFMVSRMREAWNRGASNSEAIVEGVSQTGGIVTAAAIILVGALSGFIFGHFAGLQQLGVGLAVGIFIDATIIRGLLLPSAMVLLGRWNWWLPASLARLLKVKASPLGGREARL